MRFSSVCKVINYQCRIKMAEKAELNFRRTAILQTEDKNG